VCPNSANLTLMRDVGKAVCYHRKALMIKATHSQTTRRLGEACMLLGDLKEAYAAFAASMSAATSAGDTWGEMAAHVGLGPSTEQPGT